MAEIQIPASRRRSIPGSLPVFSLRPPAVSGAALLQAARALGAPAPSRGAETILGESWMTFQDGPFVVALHRRSGALTYRDRRWTVTPETRFDLDDRRSVAIARAFVHKARLLPDAGARLVVAGVTHLRMRGGPPGGEPGPETLLDAGVVFRRQLEGVPVIGPGGLVMVNLSGDGAVVGADRVWRALGRRTGRADVVDLERAIARLRSIYARKDLLGAARVTRIEFGYFEAGVHDTQAFLEPAYAFMIEVERPAVDDAPALRSKTVEVIPAIARPRQRWTMTVPRTPSPSPARRVAASRR
jgi:hypothetical protein